MATITLNPSTAAPGATIIVSGSAPKKTFSRFVIEGVPGISWQTSASGIYSRSIIVPLGLDRTVSVVLQQRNAAQVYVQLASAVLTIRATVPVPPVDTTAPVITNVQSISGPTGATIKWDANEPCTGQVQYGLTPTAFNLSSVLESSFAWSSHSQILSGLTPGVTYYYRVRSADAAGNMATYPTSGALSFTVLGAPLPPPPLAPTLAATTPIGSVAVSLSWMPTSSPITEYRIYRALVPAAPTLILSTPALTYLDVTGLVNGATYSYQVSAVNAAGEGPKSALRTVTPAAPRISNVAHSSITTTRATIGWTLDEPATGQVEYGTIPTYGQLSTLEPTYISGHVQSLINLAPDTLYYYRVKSVDVAGNTAYSAGQSFRTLAATPSATVPGAPTGLGLALGNGQITLSWTAPASNGGSAITGYQIWRNSAWFASPPGVGLSYVNTGLVNGQPYTYAVVAVNAIGGGPQSTPQTGTPSAGSTSIYGPGIGFETKSNHHIGGYYPLAKSSCRFRASQSSAVAKVAINQRFGSDGYSLGTGGTCKLDIYADSGGVPTGPSLGSVIFSPGNPGTAERKTQYNLVTPALVAGNFYHLVASNTHASAASNYFSINFVLEWGSPADPFVAGEATALYNTGGGWSVINGEVPVFDIQYANGQHDGQMYYEHSNGPLSAIIAGTANMARVRFTVSGGNRTVTSLKIKVRRNSGTSPLIVRLEYGDGTPIESVSVPSSGILVAANDAATLPVSWVTATFTTPRTLLNGQIYNIRLSTAAGTQYGVRPIRWKDMSDTGSMSVWNGYHFRDGAGNANGSSGQKTTDGGGSWSDLYPWDPVDIGFYFLVA